MGLTLHGLTAIVRPVPPTLSILIPTLDAAGALGATLDGMAPGIARLDERGTAVEVVIADGGSRDGTAAEARRHGARVVEAEAGRGRQLAAGAAAAAGAWLLFLHADTCPAAGWDEEMSAFIGAPGNEHRAACFRFALDDSAVAARLLERLVALRCWLLALPYGDQGLLDPPQPLRGARRLPPAADDGGCGFRAPDRPAPALLSENAGGNLGGALPARGVPAPHAAQSSAACCSSSSGVRAETVARLYG